ncbi:MAG: hypothetical protein DMG92_03995 [Acidobacteria bacterium]|nr:MAG: hypothetical protein DMG92_03995 [Acidobacteriota bacterium]
MFVDIWVVRLFCAGDCILPSFERDSRFTRAEIFGFAIVLMATTILPVAGKPGYLIAMTLAATFLLYHVIKLMRAAEVVLAGGLLHASVLYLMIAYKH